MGKVAAITARHWKPLFCLNLLVMGATVASFATSNRVWTATTKLILPKTTSALDANLGTLGSLRNGDADFSAQVNPLKVQTSILTSDALLEQVLAVDPEKEKFGRLTNYKGLFTVTPEEQSTILALTASGSSPEVAKARAVAITKAYQQRLDELRQANSTARKQFSQRELNEAKRKLAESQEKLAQFKQSSGLVSNQDQTSGMVGTINTLTTARAQAQAQAQANAAKARALSERLSLEPGKAMRSLTLGENKDFQFVRNKLAEVEAELTKKRATYTDDYPQVRDLITERNQLQQRLQGYVNQAASGNSIDTTVSSEGQGRASLIQQLAIAESEAASQQKQSQQLESQITQLNNKLKALPQNQAQLLELQRQADVAEGVYKGLVAQVQQNNIDAFDAYPNVQILDPARVDAKPVSPKLSLLLINAFLASVIGSVALVLFLESRNPLLSPKDLQDQKFPVVVRIPRLKHPSMKWDVETDGEVEFQRFASTISLQPLPNRRLLVTSATVGEGKTTITLGLACALVDLGFKVLLVDGDFRQAELSRTLGYSQPAKELQTPVNIRPNLDLLPTLPKHGKVVEMIRRGGFELALADCEAKGDYDYVLVDSAPVSLTSETALLASIIPNVLFVVRPETSYKNPVNDSLGQLTQHNAQVLGLVINGVETNVKPYPYRAVDPVAGTGTGS